MRGRSGFTLIELLVVTLLFGLIVIGVFNVLSTGNNVYDVSTGKLDVAQEARRTMFTIVKEVRQATSLTINNTGKITFSTPSASNIQYYLNGTNLVRGDASGTHVLAAHISNLSFSNPGGQATLLKVLLTVSKPFMLRNHTFSLIELVRLRNE